MANKKGNRQIGRTRNAIVSAYLAMLQESPSKKIKISEICRLANISRPTFYNHFQTKDEILLLYLDEILEEIFLNFRKNLSLNESFSEFRNAATHFFSLWEPNADLFTLIKASKSEHLLIKKLNEHHLTTYHQTVFPLFPIEDPEILTYFMSHLSFVFFSILEQWMATKMKRSPEEMGELLSILFEPLLIKSLSERYNKNI